MTNKNIHLLHDGSIFRTNIALSVPVQAALNLLRQKNEREAVKLRSLRQTPRYSPLTHLSFIREIDSAGPGAFPGEGFNCLCLSIAA